jgi:hypothetical protein
MLLLRISVGFMLFHLAFWFRGEGYGTVWFGAAVALSSAGVMLGNAVGPKLRTLMREETMLVSALALPAVVGMATAVLGGPIAGIALGVSVNFSAALGRLAFESIVQRDAPGVNRGQVFARYETRFQFGWVIGATVPVLIAIPGALGYLLVALMASGGVLRYRVSSRRPVRRSSRR